MFSPGCGGSGMPIGRLSGLGVNSSTRFPYALGASSNGEGAMTFGGFGEFGVVAVGAVVVVAFAFALAACLFVEVFAAAGPCSVRRR